MVKLQTIKDYAYEANKKYFDGALRLRDIDFQISNRMISVLGQFAVSRNGEQKIKLSSIILSDPKEWHNTLVHELVHAWQYQKKFQLGHGGSFKLMASRIRKVDPKMNITTTAKKVGGEVKQAIAAKRAQRDHWSPKGIALISKTGEAAYFERCGRIRPSDIKLAWGRGYTSFFEFGGPLGLELQTDIRTLRQAAARVEIREVQLNFQGNATIRNQIQKF